MKEAASRLEHKGRRMIDQGYWLARLRRLEDQILEHEQSLIGEVGKHTNDYREGYAVGRHVAYQRARLLVENLRREVAADAARQAGPRPGRPA